MESELNNHHPMTSGAIESNCNEMFQAGLKRIFELPRMKNIKSMITDPKQKMSTDWKRIELKIVNSKYSGVDEFSDDVNRMKQTSSGDLLTKKQLSQKVRDFFDYLEIDIKLIKSCAECYWNELIDATDKWFTQTCSKAHPVVLVKFPRCQFAPAKIMDIGEDTVFVRLFVELSVANVPYEDGLQLYSKSKLPVNKLMSPNVRNSIKDANLYIENIIKRFGCYNYGEPGSKLTAQHLLQHSMYLTTPPAGATISRTATPSPHASKRIKLEPPVVEDDDRSDSVSTAGNVGDATIDIEDDSDSTHTDTVRSLSSHTANMYSRRTVSTMVVSSSVQHSAPPILRDCSSRCQFMSPESEVESLRDELEKVNGNHKVEISSMTKSFNEIIKQMRKDHETELSKIVRETKSKQWCANCWHEAKMYCCWETSYCDDFCQRRHWPQHKAKCANKQFFDQDENC